MDLTDFVPDREHLLLMEVNGDFRYHNDGLHLERGVLDDNL